MASSFPGFFRPRGPRPEPAWHRRQRRQRGADRVLLHLASAYARLLQHHGSSPPRSLAVLAHTPTRSTTRPSATSSTLRAAAPVFVPAGAPAAPSAPSPSAAPTPTGPSLTSPCGLASLALGSSWTAPSASSSTAQFQSAGVEPAACLPRAPRLPACWSPASPPAQKADVRFEKAAGEQKEQDLSDESFNVPTDDSLPPRAHRHVLQACWSPASLPLLQQRLLELKARHKAQAALREAADEESADGALEPSSPPVFCEEEECSPRLGPDEKVDTGAGVLPFLHDEPTFTGSSKTASKAKVIPAVKGKLHSVAFRVPTTDVTVIDLTAEPFTEASYDDICAELTKRCEGHKKGFLAYSDDPYNIVMGATQETYDPYVHGRLALVEVAIAASLTALGLFPLCPVLRLHLNPVVKMELNDKSGVKRGLFTTVGSVHELGFWQKRAALAAENVGGQRDAVGAG